MLFFLQSSPGVWSVFGFFFFLRVDLFKLFLFSFLFEFLNRFLIDHLHFRIPLIAQPWFIPCALTA
jgi:hypothetical protein